MLGVGAVLAQLDSGNIYSLKKGLTPTGQVLAAAQ
jgi:hypothetical protein